MKKVYSIALVGLGFCFGAVSTNLSANASELLQDNSRTILAGEMSHSEMKMTNYLVGTVANKSREIMLISVEDGRSFETDGYIKAGTKVLVGVDSNGKYHLVSSDKSDWMSVLNKDTNAQRSQMLMGEMGTSTASMNRMGVDNDKIDTTVYDPAGSNTETTSIINRTSTGNMSDRDELDSTRVDKYSDNNNRTTQMNTTTRTSSMSDRDELNSTRVEKYSDDNTTTTQMNTISDRSMSDRDDLDSTRIEKHSDDKTNTTQMNNTTQMRDRDSMDMDMDMDDDNDMMMQNQSQPVRGLW